MVGQKLLLTVSEEYNGVRLDRFIRHHYPAVTQGVLEKWLRKGDVRLNDRRIKASARVIAGQVIMLPPAINSLQVPAAPTAPAEVPPSAINQFKAAVLYEDDTVVVLNKPSGLPTQGGTKVKLSVDAIARSIYPEIYIVHRLDRDTSGVLLLAKTPSMARCLASQFQKGTIEKTYEAIVVSTLPAVAGVFEAPLRKKMVGAQEKIYVDYIEGAPALTKYRCIAEAKTDQGVFSWLLLMPQTGRTHQLRVHCAHAGAPILGDGKYGGKFAHPFEKRTKLNLHAKRLRFNTLSRGTKEVEAPLPAHMEYYRLNLNFFVKR